MVVIEAQPHHSTSFRLISLWPTTSRTYAPLLLKQLSIYSCLCSITKLILSIRMLLWVSSVSSSSLLILTCLAVSSPRCQKQDDFPKLFTSGAPFGPRRSLPFWSSTHLCIPFFL